MSRKPRKRTRPGRPTSKRRPRPVPLPHPPDTRPEPEPEGIQTSIGTFVYHPDDPPYVQYNVFRPDHAQAVEEVMAQYQAGEEMDYEEAWRRISRFGVLMVAADQYGVTANLYLDRKLVSEDEVETLVQGTFELLDQIPLGPDGGALDVYWVEEITSYSFLPEEQVE